MCKQVRNLKILKNLKKYQWTYQYFAQIWPENLDDKVTMIPQYNAIISVRLHFDQQQSTSESPEIQSLIHKSRMEGFEFRIWIFFYSTNSSCLGIDWNNSRSFKRISSLQFLSNFAMCIDMEEQAEMYQSEDSHYCPSHLNQRAFLVGVKVAFCW